MTAADTTRRIGRRGAALLVLAAVGAGVGWSFIDPTPEQARSQSAVWREHFAPAWAWGGLWLAVGTVCLIAAFFRRDVVGFTAAVGITLLWSTLELTGWVSGQITQGYRPSLIWAGYSLLIFIVAGLREPGRRTLPPQTPEGGTT